MNGARARQWLFRAASVYVAASIGWLLVQPLKGLRSINNLDFIDPLTAARILRSGSRCIYCPSAQQAVSVSYLHQIPQPQDGSNFVDPPLAAFILQPLAGLEAHVAVAILLTVSWICMIAAAWLLYRYVLPATLSAFNRLVIVGATLVTVPVASSIWEGQWVQILLLALVGAVLLVKRGNYFLAGLLLSVLFLKFQLIWLLPFVLIGTRQWRIFWGIATGGAAWIASTVLILGFDHLGDLQSALSSAYDAVPYTTGFPGLVATITSSSFATNATFVVLGAAVFGLALRFGDRFREHPTTAIALGLTASMVSTPHLLPYDLVLLALPICLLAAQRPVAALCVPLFLRCAQELAEIVHTQVHVEWLAIVFAAAALAMPPLAGEHSVPLKTSAVND